MDDGDRAGEAVSGVGSGGPTGPVTRRPRRSGQRHLVLLTAVAAPVATAHQTGLLGTLTDSEQLESLADGLGWFGPVAFTVVFTALVPLGVPGLVFVLPAAVIFPAPVAIAVVLAGGYGSSAIGMWFARTVGRERVEARLPERFSRWNDQLSRRGILAVVVLRTLTYLAAPADWVLGLTKIPARDLAIGTALGLIPPTLVYVYVGDGLFQLLG